MVGPMVVDIGVGKPYLDTVIAKEGMIHNNIMKVLVNFSLEAVDRVVMCG